MVWHDNMYLGKNCIRKANRLKYKISNRIPHPTTYLVTLPASPHAVLEMIPSTVLMQERYPRENLTVVGMGASRGEGMELISRIIQDVYAKQHDFDVTGYLNTLSEKD